MEEMAANIKQNADNAAQTEKIARQSANDAEASGDAVEPRRAGDADHRREDHHRAGDRPSDRSSRAQRRRGSRPRRRTRQGLRGGRFGSAQACRTQPGGRRRNRHAVGRDRQGRPRGRRDADQSWCRTSNAPRNWSKRSAPPAASRMSAPTRSTRRSSSSTRSPSRMPARPRKCRRPRKNSPPRPRNCRPASRSSAPMTPPTASRPPWRRQGPRRALRRRGPNCRPLPARPSRRRPAARRCRQVKRPVPPSQGTMNGSGVKLDLGNGGADAHDAEFERY